MAMGFSLHADPAVHGNDSPGLERLARSGSRGPISESRLRRLNDGGCQATPNRGQPFTRFLSLVRRSSSSR
ncbi:MAG: transposase [Myxococcaceae bacterium]|nr:transposase [Myxococcaceae bacterium]MCA3016249.1 transposase [Myxococcaceae bacterium]